MAIIPTSGEFTKVPEGGGGDVFVVRYSQRALDKTANQIIAARDAGKMIVLVLAGKSAFFYGAVVQEPLPSMPQGSAQARFLVYREGQDGVQWSIYAFDAVGGDDPLIGPS